MPIVALPQTTVRAIGSTSVIFDACSVVKELIDNALDASATSLQVEISQNTLDIIQLKDNGHGIPTEDHPSVCKHTFTSKIQTVDDLKNIAGTSLGFRGEALASVAEMSGGVTISTRSASEVTGTCLKYARDGELLSSVRTSHPAGTTLRITDFLKYIPVRRQTALKDATKTLAKIKKLLQTYAFARPAKRFSIKVLKAKNENNNWMYAPSPDAQITDAAMKIVGRDVASCCVVKKSPSVSSDQSSYELLAFLPKADADIAKANNQGQFLYVDGRPLSVNRGIGQDVAKLFKAYVRVVASRNDAAKSTADPFLCLQVKCPAGTYDVNVEPGKDDVLFEDREVIISMIDSLFCDHYGPLPEAQKTSPRKPQKASSDTVQRSSGFEILMSRTRQDVPSRPARSPEIPATVAPASPLSQRVNRSSGPSSPANSRDDASNDDTGNGSATSECRSSRFSNPWSISRINASFQSPQRQRVSPSYGSQTVIRTPQHDTGHRNAPPRSDYQSPPESPELANSSAFGPVSISPVARQHRPQPTMESPPEMDSTTNSARKAARERDKERYGNGALDTWFQRTTGTSLARDSLEPATAEASIPTLSQLAEDRFQPQSQAQPSNPVVAPDICEPREDASEVSESHPSPEDNGPLPSGENQDQEGTMNSGRGFPVLEKWAASLHQDFDPETSHDLEWALDFERRKREVNQKSRTRSGGRDGQQDPQRSVSTGPSPHKNRYLAAKAALAPDGSPAVEAVEVDSETSLSPHDPRAYFMRHRGQPEYNETSKDGAKVRRLPTSRLPFERTPEEYDIHNICLPMFSEMSLISKSVNSTCSIDTYTRSGGDFEPFSDADRESILSSWNERLNAIIKKKYKINDDLQSSEWRVDIAPVMAHHLDQFRTK